MPVVNRYQDQPGFYVRAKVQDAIVTYQTSPTARQLFENLGYSHGSSVPWGMILELKEQGDIYTRKSGVSPDELDPESFNLSPQRQSIYEDYLAGKEIKRSEVSRATKILKKWYTNGSESKLDKFSSELESMTSEVLGSLECFRQSPYPVAEIKMRGAFPSYTMEVADGILLNCHDLRWGDSPIEFRGSVQYDSDEGTNATYEVKNGYFSSWELETGEKSTNSNLKESHESAFETDFGLRSGLGFDPYNWTEAVRKLFIFVDRYDIRPYRKGHRGLCPPEELEGQHIWVNAHTTTSSSSKKSGSGTFVITDEMVTIKLPTITHTGEVLVEIEGVTEDPTIGTPVSTIRAERERSD